MTMQTEKYIWRIGANKVVGNILNTAVVWIYLIVASWYVGSIQLTHMDFSVAQDSCEN